MSEAAKTPEQVIAECAKEVAAALEKHGCLLRAQPQFRDDGRGAWLIECGLVIVLKR